jgi:hypothetical protein
MASMSHSVARAATIAALARRMRDLQNAEAMGDG